MPQQMSEDIIPVRKGEELDSASLELFLREQFHNLSNDSLEILQFSAGHSNLTYQIKIGSWEVVLRRPPLGPVALKAHDMEREFTILSEIHPLFSVAPKPLLFSNNQSIIGSPFLLMERKHGIVLDSAFPSDLVVTKELCWKISETMVDQLVQLHSIPYKETGLTAISKPKGFMERQVYGWISRYERSKTEEIQEAEYLMKWLVEHVPIQHDATFIHYDYKLNNAMFRKDLTGMVGLFDWEMSTVGDPLADLGAAMSYWTEAGDPDLLKNGLGKPPVTVQEGFMSKNEFIESYAKKSGRDVSHIDFYLTFAYFKLAVICQQIYFRYKKGQTNDVRFSRFHYFVKSLITHGTDISLKQG